MKNLASGKIPIEKWHNPEEATNGNFTEYTANRGYSKAHWPCYFTIDLEQAYRISTIQFLLYDKDDRTHQYRLLTSVDNNTWTVHYDTGQNGLNGWQSFTFTDGINARFIRLHAINDSKVQSFHIIEFQVFDEIPDNSSIQLTLDIEISYNSKNIIVNEIGDGDSIAHKISGLIHQLDMVSKKYKQYINSEYLDQLKNDLGRRIYDISKIEREASSIRREIVNPISSNLRSSKVLQLISIFLGVIGIISFVLQVTGCI